MANIFEEVSRKIKDSYIVLWIFLASLAMLLIGGNHFIEDTLSSYYGIKELEKLFGIVPATYPLTYWTMSVAPQIAQIVFGYLYLSNTKKNQWAILMAFVALLIDFFSDTYYRSGTLMFESWEKFIVAMVFTLTYFTIGSEVFITVGFGMVVELAQPAWTQFKRLFGSFQELPKPGMKPAIRPMHHPPLFEKAQYFEKDIDYLQALPDNERGKIIGNLKPTTRQSVLNALRNKKNRGMPNEPRRN